VLALDETGKASFNHLSKNFVLSGLILPENFKPEFDKSARKLKKKFFNDEEIVFHCRDMLRKKGPFAILEDKNTEIKFWSEFVVLLNSDKLAPAFVIVDKSKAKKLGWNDIAILRRSYNKILEEFVKKHLGGNNGKIIAESDSHQDKYLIEAHNRLQSTGLPSEGIAGADYRNKITSLSLVNKFNADIDIQTADSLATMADTVYAMKMGGCKKPTKVQTIMKRLINRKITDKNNPGIFEILA
ncbi:MAG TPA: hypothetical protein PKK37_05125, partial [Candidatus Pacearchaeota archaeon]|nr:hypothetical protein [Candidatus Pacearchaeota archaeon]